MYQILPLADTHSINAPFQCTDVGIASRKKEQIPNQPAKRVKTLPKAKKCDTSRKSSITRQGQEKNGGRAAVE